MTVLLGSYSLTGAAVFGIPPLILALLTCWLTARSLEARARLRRIWASLVGLGCALFLGFLCLLLFRVSFWAPVSVALAADVCLILFIYRSRKVPL